MGLCGQAAYNRLSRNRVWNSSTAPTSAMHGHGSPPIGSLRQQRLRPDSDSAPSRLVRAAVVLLALLCSPSLSSRAAELDLRMEITWGGETQRLTNGAVFVSEGELLAVRRLGLDADLPGAMQRYPTQVVFWERSATSFDGLELTLHADASASLTVQLASEARPPQTFTVPLADFKEDGGHLFRTSLDGGHQLLVRRAQSDQMRVELEPKSTLLAPGTKLACRVTPHYLNAPAGTALRLEARLLDLAEDVRWKSPSVDLEVDGDGNAPAVPLIVPMPADAGVYTLDLKLIPRRFSTRLMPVKPLLRRRVQLCVTSGQQTPTLAAVSADSDRWEEGVEIDLADPDWWQHWIPALSLRPDVRREPIGNTPLSEIEHREGRYQKLEPGGWTAFPLPVSEPGKPHLLEIEFPNDFPQTVGISILEPNAAGSVTPPFLDSGFDVADYPPPERAGMESHRLVFWPRSQEPYLLITNRRSDTPAIFASMRVRWGAERLPPAGETPMPEAERRLLAAYYDKPLFPQNFMAAEALEAGTTPPRSLNDWNTFYSGGRRLTEYLRFAGYNAAMISVVRDGSALYPSRLLEPTPRYDNGIFFVNSQDPLPKDVLELLFRQFDESGLKLIPAFHFATPLPELEHRLRAEEGTRPGIQLENNRGQTYVSLYGTRRGLAPHYNPLDERVQAAMKNVIQEVVSRYGHHPSFGGVSLQLGPETYAQLPGAEWGLDRRTKARFQQATNADLPTDGVNRKAWLAWRAAVLADFYEELALTLPRQNPQAKLFLSPAGSLRAESVRNEMRPQLLGRGDFRGVMLEQGLDANRLTNASRVVTLRPRRQVPLADLSRRGADLNIRRSSDVDQFFHGAGSPGAINFHVPLTKRLTDLDEQSPFGEGSTTTWISSHISPSGSLNRARFTTALVAADVMTLVEGGWMIPMGQEDSLRELFATFLRLPSRDFTDVPRAEKSIPPPTIAVRSLDAGAVTYCYLVNNSPSPADVTLELTAAQTFNVRSLDGRDVQPLERSQGKSRWTISLESYDLRAVKFTAPHVKITSWKETYPGTLQQTLLAEFSELKSRIMDLEEHTFPTLPLTNAGFEEPCGNGMIPGWNFSQRPGVEIAVGPRQDRPGQALRMQVTDPNAVGWIRSSELPLPKTGRLSIRASVRTVPGAPQPAFRISFDLLSPGKRPDYRFTPLGVHFDERSSTKSPAESTLNTDWGQSYVFHFTELPVDGPATFQVGFDLFGTGEVWVDEVEVYELYFDQRERDELLRTFAVAEFDAQFGKLSEAHHYRDGYWPRFIDRYIPKSDLQRMVDRSPTPPQPAADRRPSAGPASENPEERRSAWELRWPRIPVKIPFRR